jgi:hypothetical protein
MNKKYLSKKQLVDYNPHGIPVCAKVVLLNSATSGDKILLMFSLFSEFSEMKQED